MLLLVLAAPAAAQVELPQPNRAAPIAISAQSAFRWRQGAYDVWVLRGDCRIDQGATAARADEAALWIEHAPAAERQPSKVIAYIEGNVAILPDRQRPAVRLADRSWFGRFHTAGEVRVSAGSVGPEPAVKPGVYQRGMTVRNPAPAAGVQPAQFQGPLPPAFSAQPPAAPQPIPAPPGEAAPPGLVPVPEQPPVAPVPPAGARRIRVFPRGDVPVQAQWFPDPQSNQWIAVIDAGVNLVVDGLAGFGSIDVSTDRLVIWTRGLKEPDLTGATPQDDNIPLEIYMEGNIVFRQGERVIYANRMYYDVANRVGTVLSAELLTPVRNYEGLARLRADVIQQLGEGRYLAQNAFITPSRMGEPRFRLQSGLIYFEDFQRPVADPASGQAAVDPLTGEPAVIHDRMLTSQNNLLLVGDVPIFYWPTIATDLTQPSYYLRRLRFNNDNVFGTQVLTNWDMYQLLGIRNRPQGTDWDLSLDYMSKRGLGHGTSFTYFGERLFGLEGPMSGLIDYWGIKDDGLDDLGELRRNLVPERDYRYRFLGQHRQAFGDGFELTAELGFTSDRNFIEEYFEQEWDELKDQTTDIQLKQYFDNISWSIFAQGRLNDFFLETEWLPRLDHYWLGQPLADGAFTWFEHSTLSYARLRPADPPDNPAQAALFAPLPWEVPAEGARLITRQEVDWPFQLGPVKLVPYFLGEAGYWGEDVASEDLTRLYYQTGIRASMPIWAVDPTVENQLLNVHGLAHKVVFDIEFSFSQANHDLEELPLYETLDDNNIEEIRRRLITTVYGGTLPERFDPRFYALRSGLGGWVSSPSMEIADDLTVVRLGAEQRWQTKRGMPGQRRIIDWITLDTNLSLFPDPDRDNFGQFAGLLDYDFRWHVGDRVTLVSDGIFDFFDDGQKIVSIGGFLTRPPRGSLYLGLHVLEGPISNQFLTVSYSYWMSPKWVSTLGATVDLGDEGNIGEHFGITRIGESLLVSATVNVDEARDSVGVNFAIEPRFFPGSRLGRTSGVVIPPAGAYGLE